jgi:hypothetical protein
VVTAHDKVNKDKKEAKDLFINTPEKKGTPSKTAPSLHYTANLGNGKTMQNDHQQKNVSC